CFNASRRLEGGKRKSSSVVAAWSCASRIAARLRISGGRRRDLPVAKKRSVSDEAKERITSENINYLFTPVNAELSQTRAASRPPPAPSPRSRASRDSSSAAAR